MQNSKFLSQAGLTKLWALIVAFVTARIAALSEVYAAISHTHVISNVTGLQNALDAKAPLASPALTGTPTAPTADQSANGLTQIATLGYVNTRVANAIGGLSGIEYKVVQSLPAASAASAKFIYFVKDATATGDNVYAEYFFIPIEAGQEGAPGVFEKVGDVALDLSEYWNSTNLTTMSDSEIEAICVYPIATGN